MGQGASLPVPPSTHRKSFKRNFHSPFTRRSTAQGSLSATFNYSDNEMKVNQLNVNVATEEELMTLPGVTRLIAHNIVEYRKAIGRFNKVEDLALVSGIGADRLEEIRPEICVNKRKVQSCTSSRAQSYDSLSSSEISPYNNIRPPIDINTASVFQLMSVRGINQELAASIVDFRERRGDFFSIDDLLKVKGLTQVRLSNLRPRLTVKPDLRFSGKDSFPEHRKIPNGKIPDLRIACNGLLAQDVFDIVSAYCQRPILSDVDLPKDSIRIATWNLTNMNRDKATNTAVREIFCLTVLENRISFLALQGIQELCSLQMLCDEFHFPLSKRLREWRGQRGEWKANFVPIQRGEGLYNLAFMYNKQTVNVGSVKMVQDNSMIRAAEAFLTCFGVQLPVLNVDLASRSAQSSFKTVLTTLQPHILLGDFSAVGDIGGGFMEGYQSVLSQPSDTNSSSSSSKPKFCDNIFIKECQLSLFSGKSGLVTTGLRHLAIPQGWHWNGAVSDHYPVWAQISF